MMKKLRWLNISNISDHSNQLTAIVTRALLRLERTMNLLEGGKGREDGGERVGEGTEGG